MNRRIALSLVVMAFLLTIVPMRAFAQDTTPVPGPKAVKSLPPAKSLGAGWTLAQTISPDLLSPYSFKMSPDVFSEGAAGIYLGPNGAQVILVSLIVTTNRVAIRQSWDDAKSIVQGLSLMASQDYDATRALVGQDPPKGCAEADRTVAKENMTTLPVGATVCAVDPDAVFVAIAIGNIGNLSGADASDALIEAIVQKTPLA